MIAMFQRAELTQYLRCMLSLLFALFTGACLISKQPLITNNVQHPFETGDEFDVFDTVNGNLVQKVDDRGHAVTARLVRDGGKFIAYQSNLAEPIAALRVSEIGRTGSFILLLYIGDIIAYAFAEQKDTMFLVYDFQKSDFINYLHNATGETHDWAMASNRVLWTDQAYQAGDFIEVSSLSFLEKILPDMVRYGNYTTRTGYRLRSTLGYPSSESDTTTPSAPSDNEPVLGAQDAGDASLDPDARLAEIDREIAELSKEQEDIANLRALLSQKEELLRNQADIEERWREECGGRICDFLDDGRVLYRTETYDSPIWYFSDGRIAPRDIWPQLD